MNEPGSSAQANVVLGYIAGVHGVRGWVKVYSYTEPREAIFDYQPWLLGESRRQCRPVRGQVHGKGLIASIEGIDDRDQALSLLSEEISVDRARLPALDEGEYYWSDLIGLRVINREGVDLGSVSKLMATGANDVLVVQGERERLLPFVQGVYIDQVDIAGGQITVDWDPEF